MDGKEKRGEGGVGGELRVCRMGGLGAVDVFKQG
jgi:hypothetical protein